MKNISLGTLPKTISHAFARFHMTLFIVFIVAGLGAAVMLLNGILSGSPATDGYTSPIGAGSIDQATLNRIKELHTSDADAPETALPEGRINPFGE